MTLSSSDCGTIVSSLCCSCSTACLLSRMTLSSSDCGTIVSSLRCSCSTACSVSCLELSSSDLQSSNSFCSSKSKAFLLFSSSHSLFRSSTCMSVPMCQSPFFPPSLPPFLPDSTLINESWKVRNVTATSVTIYRCLASVRARTSDREDKISNRQGPSCRCMQYTFLRTAHILNSPAQSNKPQFDPRHEVDPVVRWRGFAIPADLQRRCLLVEPSVPDLVDTLSTSAPHGPNGPACYLRSANIADVCCQRRIAQGT